MSQLENVKKAKADHWLTDTYSNYALYVVHDRALVKEDGLKPVARRALYTLKQVGATPSGQFMKTARAAGEVLAYHPHGNSSVEEAISRMAQPFNMRVPLIDNYGSVGFVTGDQPAAARYWKCRLSKPAMELLKELDEEAVPMGRSYDNELPEPGLLPIRWPSHIINGSQGIAVGFASYMLPHNPDEVINACVALLDNPKLTVKELLQVCPGPDFPTGGQLTKDSEIEQYYSTGRGTVTVKARYKVESLPRNKKRITFFELPYQVSVAQVIQKIQKLELKEIASVKDLTDRKNGVHLVIETKSNIDVNELLVKLFDNTGLKNSYAVNNTLLVDGTPATLPMLDLLRNFLNFREYCTINKSKALLGKNDKRIQQVKAVLAVLLDLDAAISIIRESKDSTQANTRLCKKFNLTEEQATYILNLPLKRLTKSDKVQLQKELKGLQADNKHLQLLLKDKKLLDEEVKKDLLAVQQVITSERRTHLPSEDKELLGKSSMPGSSATKSAGSPAAANSATGSVATGAASGSTVTSAASSGSRSSGTGSKSAEKAKEAAKPVYLQLNANGSLRVTKTRTANTQWEFNNQQSIWQVHEIGLYNLGTVKTGNLTLAMKVLNPLLVSDKDLLVVHTVKGSSYIKRLTGGFYSSSRKKQLPLSEGKVLYVGVYQEGSTLLFVHNTGKVAKHLVNDLTATKTGKGSQVKADVEQVIELTPGMEKVTTDRLGVVDTSKVKEVASWKAGGYLYK